MSGMIGGPVRSRHRWFNNGYLNNWFDYNSTNDAADEIIASPDRHLLNKDDLFAAEGGWTTFSLTMGFAAAGAAGVLAVRPGMAGHFGRGQLKAMEWLLLGGAAVTGGFVGNNVGITAFGDAQAYKNHWMAYMFVKSQNRYIGGSILTNAPTY